MCSIPNQHFELVRHILHTPVFKAIVFFHYDCQITIVIKESVHYTFIRCDELPLLPRENKYWTVLMKLGQTSETLLAETVYVELYCGTEEITTSWERLPYSLM